VKCPHCLIEFFSGPETCGIAVKDKAVAQFLVIFETCPKCKLAIIALHIQPNPGVSPAPIRYLIYPKGVARSPLPPEVPDTFVGDYREACLVLSDSPKASAALSRRCLQHVLREAGKTTRKDLAEQIDETIPKVPSYVGDLLHGVRVLGNFAAHPMKSTNTGEIIDVEPGEAELLLDTLETVFDFYFVQPARTREKRDAINAKLTAAGKPLLK
jgi:hypothetical protein